MGVISVIFLEKLKKKYIFKIFLREFFGANDVHFNSGGACLGPIKVSQLEVCQKWIRREAIGTNLYYTNLNPWYTPLKY